MLVKDLADVDDIVSVDRVRLSADDHLVVEEDVKVEGTVGNIWDNSIKEL